MSDTTDLKPGPPRWVAAAGFGLLVLTVAFLMSLVFADVFGHSVACSGRGLVVFIVSLTTGAAAGFLTGSAKAEGRIPFVGGSVMRVAAQGATAAIIIVMVLGFRLYASAQSCAAEAPQKLENIKISEETALRVADQFWTAAYVGDWKSAYELFPDDLNKQTPFPEFVKVCSRYFSQAAGGPPLRRHAESIQELSDSLIVKSLVDFDDTSTFRESLVFARQSNNWVPWQFLFYPVDWPQANTLTYVSTGANEILKEVYATPAADRPQLITTKYDGKYIPSPGWDAVVDTVGSKAGNRTCDVEAHEVHDSSLLTLINVLDGCSLKAKDSIVVQGRIQDVNRALKIASVRFWK